MAVTPTTYLASRTWQEEQHLGKSRAKKVPTVFSQSYFQSGRPESKVLGGGVQRTSNSFSPQCQMERLLPNSSFETTGCRKLRRVSRSLGVRLQFSRQEAGECPAGVLLLGRGLGYQLWPSAEANAWRRQSWNCNTVRALGCARCF